MTLKHLQRADVLLLAAIAFLVTFQAGNVDSADPPQPPTPSPILHPKGVRLPFEHQGPFITARNGDVLCMDGKHALRSSDAGRTWNESPLFTDPTKFQVSNERALLRTKEGVIVSAWMNLAERASPQGWNWGKPGVDWRSFVLPIYVCRSLDDGRTWEDPIFLNKPWCGCIHSLIQTGSGRLVLVGQEIIPEWRHATVMFVSDDLGKTWKRSNVLDYGIGNHDHAGSIEGTVVERRDGTLYQLLRTESGYLWEVTSQDGMSWEKLQQSKIRSVTCCAQMSRLNDGRIVLLWNHPPRHAPTSAGSREELSIAFSSDECVTWSGPTVIAANYGPRHRVSYPYIYEQQPGVVWITTMQGGLRMKLNIADIALAEIPVYHPPQVQAPLLGGIVMFGDSTTAIRPGAIEKVYAQRVAEALQGVASSVTVHNAGIGGNATSDALKRLDRDVLAHKPRIVVIQFGINDSAIDVWKTPPATAPRVSLLQFEQNLREIVSAVRSANAKPILMTANPLRWTPKLKTLYGRPPYRPDDADGFDTPTLGPYNAVTRKLASALSIPIVDVHQIFMKQDVDRLLLDGMHPNDQGHEVIARELVPKIRDLLN